MKFIAIKIFRFIFHKPYFITFCFLTFFILGCKKKTSEQIVKVTYEVVMINGVKTTIDYNSDYYIETGKRKEIVYNEDTINTYRGRYWTGQRYAKKSEGYYIKVNYKKYANVDSARYKVAVYLNDTLLASDFDKPDIILQGNF